MRSLVFFYVALNLLFPLSALGSEMRLKVPTLRLSEAQLEQGIALNVDWLFTGPQERHALLEVPARWEKAYNQLMPVFGRGMYHLDLELPPSALGRQVRFSTELVAGNQFRLYANHQLVGHNGSSLESHSRLTRFDVFTLREQRLRLRLEVDNQTLQWSGLVRPLYFGEREAIARHDYRQSLEFNIFFGAFCFMAFFHLVLFVFFRQDRTVFWFGLLCIAVVVYMEFFRIHNLEHLFGDIPLEWNIRCLRLALFSFLPCFFWYGRALSSSFMPRQAPVMVTALSSVFIASVILPGRFHTWLVYPWFLLMIGCILFQFYLLSRVWRQRDLAPFVYASLIFALVSGNDMLNALGLLSTGFYGRYGILAFCLTQTGFVAWRLQTNYRDTLRYQGELVDMNQNLEQLVQTRTQEVEQQNEQLNQLMSFKENMVHMFAHDLKTPLQVLSQSPEGVDRGVDKHFAARQAASTRIQLLINQMLELQDSDHGELDLHLQPHALRELCQKVIQWMQPWAVSKQLLLSNLLDSESQALIDAPLFERVIQNLLDNAIKHAPAGSEIQISGSLQADTFELCVANRGPLLSASEKEHILQKGVSLQKGDAPVSLGLGLYFCQQVILAHNGSLELLDHPDGGLIVKLTLAAHHPGTGPAWQWKPEALELVDPYARQLKALDVFQVSDIYPILNELKQIENRQIEAWSQALATAVKEVNETNYRRLIEDVAASSDRR